MHPSKVPSHVRAALERAGIDLLPYEALPVQLLGMVKTSKGRVWVDSKTLNAAVYK
ncbi:hypothetical protein EON65_06845 [archaeon]|nr:MAG: hypothetical protein EON65_06845 [archaeon]